MSRKLACLVLVPALAAAVVTADERESAACGGCFHPPPGPTEVESVVTDHRMVFSVSPSQTVLWDQIRYSGNPAQFAWVLPIHPGATLQLSHDSFIAALDASTQTVITGPSPYCGGGFSGGGGGGCSGFGGASEDNAAPAAGFSAGADSGVQIVNQAVVGPYETVTLRAAQGDSLDAWLTQNGFAIPTNVEPTIAAYASAGFDFIALKLSPGEGVGAMQPVRVVTQGADATLPLRMVAAGVGAHVGIELWVISEGRYHTQNFSDAVIDFSQLTWDHTQSRSNYTELEQAAMSGGGWVTEFAGPVPTGLQGGPNPGLVASYLATCRPDVGCATPADAAAPVDAAPDAAAPVDAAADDASDDAGDDASEAATFDASPPPPPPPPPVDAACARTLIDSCDDWDVALVGMVASDVWITRLRADLPAATLPLGDLSLEANPAQVPVSNLHTTTKYSDPTYAPCPASAPASDDSGGVRCACRTARAEDDKVSFGLVLFLVALAGVAGRLVRLRRKSL